MNKQELTDQNIIDILDAAGYGISYWASTASIDATEKTYTLVCQEHPTDDGFPRVVIPFETLREAYWKLVALDQTLVGPTVHRYFLSSYMDRTKEDGIDCGYIDGEAADCVVQVAAFGEIVFG